MKHDEEWLSKNTAKTDYEVRNPSAERHVARSYAEHMARWRSVADGELPEIGKTVIFTCYADKHSGFTDIAVGEWTGAKTLGDAISMDYGDDDDWLPCNYWKELPELPEVE